MGQSETRPSGPVCVRTQCAKFSCVSLVRLLLLSFWLRILTRESDTLIDAMWHTMCDFLYLTLAHKAHTHRTDGLIIGKRHRIVAVGPPTDRRLSRSTSFFSLLACVCVCVFAAFCARKFRSNDEILRKLKKGEREANHILRFVS